MFGLGVPELLFIMALALLIFGPKKLPQIGRTLGRGMAEFRKASTELQRSINLDLEDPPPRPKARPAAAPESSASPESSAGPEASSTGVERPPTVEDSTAEVTSQEAGDSVPSSEPAPPR
ncbi:MAG: twin-arginine translocase TatA/TatE family subunit [Thermoanaerobaculia bacterium]|nr:twin-arginine translocase TatA/TatE family subunit [Thermoanaerobaculia bacterium]